MVSSNNSDKMKSVLDKISTLTREGRQKDALGEFIDSLIAEKGFPDLTAEVREVLKKDLLKRLNDFIAARVIAILSDDDVITFDQMLKEKKSEEEMQKFVAIHIPNFVNFLTDALLEFRGIYLGLAEPTPKSEETAPSDLPPAPPAQKT
jgi:hypothetical protein